jgi:hypothetical protein
MMRTCVIILVALQMAFNANSCNCKEVDFSKKFIQDQYYAYSKIFIGNVISVSEKSFKIQVTKNFKGTNVGDIITGGIENACSIFPDRNGEWIIYADFIRPIKYIDASKCSLSRNLKTNQQLLVDINYLNQLSQVAMKKHKIPLAEYSYLMESKKKYDKFISKIMYVLTTPRQERNFHFVKDLLFISMIVSFFLFVISITRHFISLK